MINRGEWSALRERRVIATGLLVSIFVAALFAVAYFFETFDEQYFYGGDNYQVLATIVAEHNPGYFDADPVLSNPNNYRFYRTAFTALVDWTHRWLGNPGQVYGVLGIPFNVLRVFGFFLLGLWLFRSRGWALALGVVTALQVRFDAFGDWWGIPFAIHARTPFESLFPYLLLGAITAGLHLGRQVATMLAAGVATYLHPVSGPPVAFALWAVMCAAPGAGPIGTRLRNAAAAGLAYALAILPFVIHFRTNTVYGAVSFQEWDAALRAIVPEYVSPGRSLLKELQAGHVLVIFGFGAAGLLAARRYAERRVIDLLAIFSLALAFAALLVPLLDEAIAARLGRVPQELDFVRAAKYFTPIALIGLVWGAKLGWDNAADRPALLLRRVLVIGTALVCLAFNRGTLDILSRVSCDVRAMLRLSCISQDERADMTTMYRAIEREVPKGELVFVDSGTGFSFPRGIYPYGIRIYSRRPGVWSFKEGSVLLYSNPPALVEWYRRLQTMRRIEELTGEARSAALTDLMRKWKVRYVLLVTTARIGRIDLPGRILYRNASTTLIELPRETPPPARAGSGPTGR
jgi:hypothetical protein